MTKFIIVFLVALLVLAVSPPLAQAQSTTFRNVANRATGSLSSGINDSVSSLSVGSGEGATFPSSTFYVTINDEIMLVGSRTNDAFSSITRARESTSATSHDSGDTVNLHITAGTITEIHTAVNSIEDGTTTLTSVTSAGLLSVGGGYGSTGASISAAGVGQFNGNLTTDGVLQIGTAANNHTFTSTASGQELYIVGSGTGYNAVFFGAADTVHGIIVAYGQATSSASGGTFRVHTALDHSGTIDYYTFLATSDDLHIGPDTDTDSLMFTGPSGPWTFTASDVVIATGNLTINGGYLTSSAGTFNLLDSTPTTINFGGGASTINIGATAGDVNVGGDINMANEASIFMGTDDAKMVYNEVDSYLEFYGFNGELAFYADVDNLKCPTGNIVAMTGNVTSISADRGFFAGSTNSVRGVLRTWGDGTKPGIWMSQSGDGSEIFYYARNDGMLMMKDGSLPANNGDGVPLVSAVYSEMSYNRDIGNATTINLDAPADGAVKFAKMTAFINVGFEDGSGDLTANFSNDEFTVGAGGAGVYSFEIYISAEAAQGGDTFHYAIVHEPATTPAITNVTTANPAVITVNASQDWQTGDIIFISGNTGTDSANVNGARIITKTSSTTFQLYDTHNGASVDTTGGTNNDGAVTWHIHSAGIKYRKHTVTDIGSVSIGAKYAVAASDKIYMMIANETDGDDIDVASVNFEAQKISFP